MERNKALAITIAVLIALISLSCSAAMLVPTQESFKTSGRMTRKMSPEKEISWHKRRIAEWKKQIAQHEDNIKRLKSLIKNAEQRIRELKKGTSNK